MPARPLNFAVLQEPVTKARERHPVKARVRVTLKPSVLDPQGKAIRHALGELGFDGIRQVRQGKIIELDLAETDPAIARGNLEAMCEKLLVNTVIETYAIELDGENPP